MLKQELRVLSLPEKMYINSKNCFIEPHSLTPGGWQLIFRIPKTEKTIQVRILKTQKALQRGADILDYAAASGKITNRDWLNLISKTPENPRKYTQAMLIALPTCEGNRISAKTGKVISFEESISEAYQQAQIEALERGELIGDLLGYA